MTTRSRTPVADVRAAIADGAVSRTDISARTGLRRDSVDAVIDHLERTGALEREQLASGCPGGGCGSCALATACAGTGGRGPVALVLRPIGV